jgi:hypothetical protein
MVAANTSLPDIFLGWGEVEGVQFYIRQLADMKGGATIEHAELLPEYCRLCGWALALAHAKSGDAAMIAGYCGKSDALDSPSLRLVMRDRPSRITKL